VLAQERFVPHLRDIGPRLVSIEQHSGSLPPGGRAAPCRASSRSLCHVLYTSGSTGRPKGVMIEHRAAVNLLLAMASEPGLGPADVLLSVTSVAFDIFGLSCSCHWSLAPAWYCRPAMPSSIRRWSRSCSRITA